MEETKVNEVEKEIGKIAASLGGRILEVVLDEVEVVDRYRQDMGDISDLALSLSQRGQLQNLVVCENNGNEKPYRLLAGGRRYTAMKSLQWKKAFALCFPSELSELQLIEIEWEENAKRKDLTWQEETKLKKRIYDLSIATYGEKVSTSANASGVSLRDIARQIEVSPTTMSHDIKLASLVETCPEIFEKCKSKKDAHKLINKAEEQIARAELARRINAGGEEKMKRIIDSYLEGRNFLEEVKKIESESIDFLEIDPPYSIDLKNVKLNENAVSDLNLQAYNEIKSEVYMDFIKTTLVEAYRVMTPHSWLVLWFAPDPWIWPIYQTIKEVGFETTLLTGKWVKPIGQCQQPNYYLANACEQFFYCRKGNPSIVQQGRTNIFPYSPVAASKKIHPTERPIELITDILSTFCWEGARILVPFLGSGKTILAAETLGMKAFGYDLATEYKDGYVVAANELFGVGKK